MTEPDYFCPQCGPLRCEDPIQAIDEDGCCQSCGATACTWPVLLQHMRNEGYERVRTPAEITRAGWRAQFAPCPCGDQERPGHPMGWCRHDGFSHTRNVDCPPKVNPAWVGMVERAAADAEELGVSSLNPMCLTPQAECPRTYPLDPLTAEDPCEDCGRDQRKHEIGPREHYLTDGLYLGGFCKHCGRPTGRHGADVERCSACAAPPSPDEKHSAAELTDLQGLDPHEG